MKVLIVAINAKYIHSNLAAYSLRAYSAKYKEAIEIQEYTINNYADEILKGIYEAQPTVVAFSCYIWNISMIRQVAANLRKILPDIKIWYGGPEVTYNPCEVLQSDNNVDGIVIGEGEQTFLELMEYYQDFKGVLEDIKGIAFKKSAGLGVYGNNIDNIVKTPDRELMALDLIPFPYDNIKAFENKIIYYESSRGCPFSCSYCLSSIDKSIRLRNTDIVKKELKIFLENEVPQVKFVDRTFNCNRKHSAEIWTFIKENDNNITNFHFEISADLLQDEDIILLESLRPGQVQLEIGIQSTNMDTINAIHRKMDFERLSQNVRRLKAGHNIHIHLDLIAGLPLEDLASFIKSFNEAYLLRPEQLQLGFLKVLKGSAMESDSSKYDIVYRDEPPYEVLSTHCLTFSEVLRLKGVCEMIESYYNSGQFRYSMEYLLHFFEQPYDMYSALYDYYRLYKLEELAHNKIRRYEILLAFYHEMPTDKPKIPRLFEEILYFDLCLRDNVKNRPNFAPNALPYREVRSICEAYGKDKGSIKVEHFNYDIIGAAKDGKDIKIERNIIFDYSRRDPLNKDAEMTLIVMEL